MSRHHVPNRANKRRADTSRERPARDESDNPVPTRPAEEGEQPQSPGAKPLVKKQQQQH